MQTSQEWWLKTKSDPDLLSRWLRRQYVGEMASVGLLSELLVKYGCQAGEHAWTTVHKIMCQEALHGRWIKDLLDRRMIAPDLNPASGARYWAEIRPGVNSFAEGCAAAFHAENMRLERIRVICAETDPELADIRAVFAKILPQEEWHEKAFNELRQKHELTKYHAKGLEALNLLMV